MKIYHLPRSGFRFSWYRQCSSRHPFFLVSYAFCYLRCSFICRSFLPSKPSGNTPFSVFSCTVDALRVLFMTSFQGGIQEPIGINVSHTFPTLLTHSTMLLVLYLTFRTLLQETHSARMLSRENLPSSNRNGGTSVLTLLILLQELPNATLFVLFAAHQEALAGLRGAFC